MPNRYLTALLVAAAALATTSAQAQEDTYECTDIEPEFYDPDYPYTDQELIALRSEELDRTLGELTYCQGKGSDGQGTGSGSGSGSGTGGGTGVGGSGSTAGAGTSGGPIPSSISGTEPRVLPTLTPRVPQEGRDTRREIDREEIVLGNPPPPREQRQEPTPGDSGAPPERIRRVDNDDAVAAQIRKAAEAETDPTRKQALWEEYYRYTGKRPPPSP